MMAPAERERGAALLTVLLLVAVISVMATAGLERLRLATRLGGNAVQVGQARAYAQAAEALALSRVDALLGLSPDRVSLAGDWSGRPFGLPVPEGIATARVSDGGNCFNLNGLVTPVGPGVYATNPGQRVQFTRLLRLLGVPGQTAEQVAGGAADWIDTDADQQPSGAEDPIYLAQTNPYRTAGTLMTDRSELRAVAGVTPELYAQLRPWLCALPRAEAAAINVNTVTPEQAALLAMLGPETLSVEAVRAALLRRPPQGWADPSTFWSAAGAIGSGAAVRSQWFALRIDVTVGRTQMNETALIDATRLPARLVARQWGEDL
jgi:general secretion pathway protein K